MRLPIDKRQVWQAYLAVRPNDGTYGADQEDWATFDRKVYHNLYQIWNRLSSGAYFPTAVRRVMLRKAGGGERPLGIPSVRDRIVQEVLRKVMEPYLEPHFHASSYAYRRGKNAHEAIRECRYNTDYYSWCVDLDIRGYFDNIPHDKLMQAVVHFCPKLTWLHCYLWRILKAPVQMPDGSMQEVIKGVPQGGVIFPLLSNLYLHVVFDKWIGKQVKAKFAFERYADDIIIHSSSEKAAQFILKLVKERMLDCGLELHPEKTKLVQTESHRRELVNKSYPSSFVFLGHQFSKDLVRLKDGSTKLLYVAKVSKDAHKRMLRQLKYEKLHKRTCRLEELAAQLNQKVAGWVSYFGKYAGTSMHRIYAHINRRLVKWVMWKYRKFKLQAIAWLKRKWLEQSMLFVHWQQTKFFCIY